MEATIRVLVVEDSVPDFEHIEHELKRTWPNAVSRRVDSESDYRAALAEGYDIVLADYVLPGFDVIRALGLLRENSLDVPLIVVSGASNDEELVAECIRRGAADYLRKDRLARLGEAIARALLDRVLRAQRAQAEVELRRSKEHYQRLVETVKAIPWELDPADWRLTYIGPQAQQLLGYAMDKGCPYSMWIEKIHPKDRSRVRLALRDALLPNKDQDVVHRILTASGSTVWMRSIVSSPCRDNGSPLLRGFTVDITAAKQAERSLARLAEELARCSHGIVPTDGEAGFTKSLGNLSAALREGSDVVEHDPQPVSQPSASPQRILLIDDNAGDIRLITEALQAEAPGIEIISVSDSMEAIPRLKQALAAGDGPHLALLDLQMPKKSGLQVLEEIKADPATAYLPVVVLTSSEADQDVHRAYSLRANSLVAKPLGYVPLRSTIKTICDFWLGVAHLPAATPVGYAHHENTAD